MWKKRAVIHLNGKHVWSDRYLSTFLVLRTVTIFHSWCHNWRNCPRRCNAGSLWLGSVDADAPEEELAPCCWPNESSVAVCLLLQPLAYLPCFGGHFINIKAKIVHCVKYSCKILIDTEHKSTLFYLLKPRALQRDVDGLMAESSSPGDDITPDESSWIRSSSWASNKTCHYNFKSSSNRIGGAPRVLCHRGGVPLLVMIICSPEWNRNGPFSVVGWCLDCVVLFVSLNRSEWVDRLPSPSGLGNDLWLGASITRQTRWVRLTSFKQFEICIILWVII